MFDISANSDNTQNSRNSDVHSQLIDAGSFSENHPNTKILYIYRDADNYKQTASIVIPGAISLDQTTAIIDTLDCGQDFVPSGVGLPDLQEQMVNGWDDTSDHPYHELEQIGLTHQQPTDTSITPADLLRRFQSADWEQAAHEVTAKHQST